MSKAKDFVAQIQREFYKANGYVIISGLFSAHEVQYYCDHYMKLREAGEHPGDFSGVDLTSADPLKRYPRMIHMHHWDEQSLRWMIDARLNAVMIDLLGAEPLGVQTMLYFKPPGARGQALHQDNYYLRVQPGTCMAAWMSLDRCDEENGCMQVVPGSHLWPVLCPEKADTTQSFTDVTVRLPREQNPVPVIMEAGDVLFFNGSLVHGSFPNRSTNRFRRALIGHYIEGDTKTVSEFYAPVYRMDGTVVKIEATPTGGPCGVWVEQDGTPVVEFRQPALPTPTAGEA